MTRKNKCIDKWLLMTVNPQGLVLHIYSHQKSWNIVSALPLFCILLSILFQMFHRVGVKEGNLCQPTYVYPEEVKMLMRSVFSQDICDYPDPCHDQVSMSSFHNSFCLRSNFSTCTISHSHHWFCSSWEFSFGRLQGRSVPEWSECIPHDKGTRVCGSTPHLSRRKKIFKTLSC